jgi:glycosyltransferase involved in cell wall biosynthesis
MRSAAEALVNRPNLIILTHLNFCPAANWVKRVSGIPFWCVAHGIEAWSLRDRSLIRGLHNAARIFAVSSYTRARILDEQALDADRVRILPNTFRPEVFRLGPKPEALLARHGISPGKKVILTVCRLSGSEQYKGYDQLIRALPQVLAAVPEAHYVLVGDGTDRARIEQMVRSLGIDRSVTLAGRVSQPDLPDYYNLCDLFAMPSKGEGFGIVYLEALACGKPVLAGNGDGSRDPLQNGSLGVLVNPESVPEIARATIDILNGNYPMPLLYRPAQLRARTIEAFGPERFLAKLRRQLEDFHERPMTGVKVSAADLCVGSP